MKVIILAGGNGKRLWPLSREDYPKQFIKLHGSTLSLFAETFKRSLLLANFNDIYIVANEKYKYLVMNDVEELGYNYQNVNILLEPEGKNTLPAIYAGVYELSKKGNVSESVVVFPSDHTIAKSQEFSEIVKLSEELSINEIITFGIKPDSPKTGYGYIALGVKKLNGYQVKSFKEKPNHNKALAYIQEGYYWNSGIFMFNSKLFIEEVKKYNNNIYSAFETTTNINDAFGKINKSISIDYGIMERSHHVAVVPVDIGWNDLGSFDAFDNIGEKDKNNNQMVNEENIAINSNNNYIYSDKKKLVATIGVSDFLIIDNPDALLICKKNQAEQVKEIVEILKERNDKRSEHHILAYRPWGYYKVLEEEKNEYKIKKITVKKYGKLSYQLHYHRSECWVVVKGIAKVTIDGIEKVLTVGENIFIKSGQKHLLENLGDINLEIMEVQFGDYLEEDDIVRFDDEYGRF